MVLQELVPSDVGDAVAHPGAPRRASRLNTRAYVHRFWPVTLLGLYGFVAAAAMAGGHREHSIGRLGLFDALPAVYWLSVAVISGVFFFLLFEIRERQFSLSLSAAALIVLLHGAASLIEREPRFATAYIHVGMVDQIVQNGTLLPEADARFNWAGFFGAAATFVQATHLSSAKSLLEIAPVLAVMSYVPPTLYLARIFLGGWRRPWIAVWALICLNWVGQDYFAPQTFSFALYLYCLALAFMGLRGMWSIAASVGRLRVPGMRLLARMQAGTLSLTDATPVAPAVQRLCVIIVCAGIVAVAMSHQLTPIILTLDLGILILLGVLGNGSLFLFAVLATAGWISYGAFTFWIGHWAMMFGNVGQVESVVGSSVADRFEGDSVRLLVLAVRSGMALLVWAGAAVGLVLDAWRHRRFQWTLAALILVPFSLLASQSYGGEAALRVLLFSLPFSAMGIALIVREESLEKIPVLAVAALLTVALAVPFTIARYGNEDFERARPADVDAVEALYRIAPPGAQAVAVSPELPWRNVHVFGYDYQYIGADAFTSGDLRRITDVFTPNPNGQYLIVTPSQLTHAQRVFGISAEQFALTIERLKATGDFHVEYARDGAVVLSYEGGQP